MEFKSGLFNLGRRALDQFAGTEGAGEAVRDVARATNPLPWPLSKAFDAYAGLAPNMHANMGVSNMGRIRGGFQNFPGANNNPKYGPKAQYLANSQFPNDPFEDTAGFQSPEGIDARMMQGKPAMPQAPQPNPTLPQQAGNYGGSPATNPNLMPMGGGMGGGGQMQGPQQQGFMKNLWDDIVTRGGQQGSGIIPKFANLIHRSNGF